MYAFCVYIYAERVICQTVSDRKQGNIPVAPIVLAVMAIGNRTRFNRLSPLLSFQFQNVERNGLYLVDRGFRVLRRIGRCLHGPQSTRSAISSWLRNIWRPNHALAGS